MQEEHESIWDFASEERIEFPLFYNISKFSQYEKKNV